jgi:hypothetical protein
MSGGDYTTSVNGFQGCIEEIKKMGLVSKARQTHFFSST